MKFKYILLIFSSFYILSSCKNKENNSVQSDEKIIDTNLASLYPLNNQILELQNLEFVENLEENRNLKNTSSLKNNLETTLYKRWCQNGDCFQLNSSLILEVIPQNDNNSIKASSSDINFIIPNKNGIVSATSLPNENIYTIKLWDNQLIEKWNTIYERSKLDSNGQNIQYAQVLGYNDQLLVFNSSDSDIPKSGYVLLKSGYKKQEEYQWSGILIDEDNTTVLGQIIKNNDLGFSIRIGSTIIDLPESVTGYSKCNSLVRGNKIYLGFYHPKSDLLKIITLDYHSGKILWEYAIASSKSIENIYISGFQYQFLIEIESISKNSLYILQKENGVLVDKF